jgi:hypothetical protein
VRVGSVVQTVPIKRSELPSLFIKCTALPNKYSVMQEIERWRKKNSTANQIPRRIRPKLTAVRADMTIKRTTILQQEEQMIAVRASLLIDGICKVQSVRSNLFLTVNAGWGL